MMIFKVWRVVKKFGPKIPAVIEMLEALWDGDDEKFARKAYEASRRTAIRAAARKYLDGSPD